MPPPAPVVDASPPVSEEEAKTKREDEAQRWRRLEEERMELEASYERREKRRLEDEAKWRAAEDGEGERSQGATEHAGADESATSRSRSRDRSWIAWHEQEVEQLRAKYEEELKTIRDREPPVSWEDLWHIAQQYPDIPSDGIICGDSTSHCRAGLNLCADCGAAGIAAPIGGADHPRVDPDRSGGALEQPTTALSASVPPHAPR